MFYFKNAFLALLYFLPISFSWSAEIELALGCTNYEEALNSGHFMVDNSELKNAILETTEKIVSFYYPPTSGKSSNASMLSYLLEKDGFIVLKIKWMFSIEHWQYHLKNCFKELHSYAKKLVQNSDYDEKDDILLAFNDITNKLNQKESTIDLSEGLNVLLKKLDLVFPDKKIVMIIDEFDYALQDALDNNNCNEFRQMNGFRLNFLQNLSTKALKIITFGVNPIGLADFLMKNPNLIKISSATSSADFCQFFATEQKNVNYLLENMHNFEGSYECLKRRCWIYSLEGNDFFQTMSLINCFIHGNCNEDVRDQTGSSNRVKNILSTSKPVFEAILSLLEKSDSSLEVEVSSTFKYRDNFFENITPQEALAFLINIGKLFVNPKSQHHVKDGIYSVEVLPLNFELKVFYARIISNIVEKKIDTELEFSDDLFISTSNKADILSALFPE